MLLWAERLEEFSAALRNSTLAIPRDLVGPDGEPAAKRFAVYRNNVVSGLVDALQAAYPAVCGIVGEEFFREMARIYALAEPPVSPILLDYGAGFANFIAAFEPAKSLPYLPDVARIERAWVESFHAPDAVLLTADALAAIEADRVPDTRFVLHPSLRIVASEFPALTIWRMNVADGVPAPVDFELGGEVALVVRPAADVEVRSMPPGGAEFVAALSGGATLTAAMRSAISVSPDFDLLANIAALVDAGAFASYSSAQATYGFEKVAIGDAVQKRAAWQP